MTFVIFALPIMTILAIAWFVYEVLPRKPHSFEYLPPPKPFRVSEYLGRIEQAQIEILEQRDPVDQVVILWWGLDGLTLDENGELKWISRKKKVPSSPVYPGYFDFIQNMCNGSFSVYPTGCAQTATIRSLQMQNAALQMQACQQTQMQNMTSQLQNCCARPTWM